MRKTGGVNIILGILKLTVFLACVGIGIHYLREHQPDWNRIDLAPNAALILLAIVGLAVVNWLVEALKWHHLISRIVPLSRRSAITATLSGVAVSFVTPFRIGDFLGRVLHLPSHRRIGSVLTFYGNFAQLLATLLFGLAGLAYISAKDIELFNTDLVTVLLLCGSSAMVVSLVLLYAPMAVLKLFRLQEVNELSEALNKITPGTASFVLGASLLRYVIFLTQYVLCFLFFGSDLDFSLLFPLITLLYVLITFVPSPLLGKLGVRESVGLYLIGPYEDPSVILSASLLIWGINLFIPAISGAYFLMKVKARNSD